MRLDKFLADCTAATRSQCRQLIRQGRVSVNREIIKDGAYQISETDHVMLDENQLNLQKNLYYMFHKPAGCICATKDEHQKTVLEYFPTELRKKLLIAGRLDIDTEGLLFLTDDGAFVHSLMSPKKHVPKTYYFESTSELCADAVSLAEGGIDIGDEKPTLPAKLILTGGADRSCEDYKTATEQHKEEIQNTEFISGYLTIAEGRYHQVKRMVKALGGEVTYLKRISVGEVRLDETLKPGEYRPLTEAELNLLYKKKS